MLKNAIAPVPGLNWRRWYWADLVDTIELLLWPAKKRSGPRFLISFLRWQMRGIFLKRFGTWPRHCSMERLLICCYNCTTTIIFSGSLEHKPELQRKYARMFGFACLLLRSCQRSSHILQRIFPRVISMWFQVTLPFVYRPYFRLALTIAFTRLWFHILLYQNCTIHGWGPSITQPWTLWLRK